MTTSPTLITRADILPMEQYASERRARRKALITLKKNRRMAVGPHATFHFENYETMWHQVHEMLYIERGGEAQIQDELEAYNPLIPQGRELVATVMFEIADPAQRKRILGELGGVEQAMFISVGGSKIRGMAEADMDRTRADGKTSSVHFVHFPFDDEAVDAMRSGNAEAVVAIEHPQYGHMAVVPEHVRRALSEDFRAPDG